jgi:3',5'-cyclic AMP phosphodiesterase CpdA
MKVELKKMVTAAFGVCACTLVVATASAQSVDGPNLFFISDVTQCNSQSQANALAVKSLVGDTDYSILMTEANNCSGSYATAYQYVSDIWNSEYERIYAVPGNHDYMTGIEGFENYFGNGLAVLEEGVPNSNWKIIRINTNYPGMPYGGGGMDESQWYWQKIGLRTVLNSFPYQGITCVLIYGHHPRYTSGMHQTDANMSSRMQEIWDILDEFDVELYISGHDHLYERMYPMDAEGNRVTDGNGTVQIISGTGGADLRGPSAVQSNSAKIISEKHGLLEIELGDNSFRTAFVDTDENYYDVYTGACH